MITHPAEIKIRKYLSEVKHTDSIMSEEIIDRVTDEIRDSLKKQFVDKSNNNFRLRMSNLGRPYCQLWFDKNKPETALPRPTTFVMNMMLGDIVEAVFKGLLTEAGVEYGDSESVSLNIGEHTINGTYDLTIDGAVDDVKSASDWSYRNKFESFETLRDGDAFGYVGQLVGYAKATGLKPGGWWVVNKANGSFKYVPATGVDEEKEMLNIMKTVKTVDTNKFKRCFEPVEETFRGKATGNKMLCKECSFCDYRKACWPKLKELPAVKSQAKQPKIVSYVELKEEYVNG